MTESSTVDIGCEESWINAGEADGTRVGGRSQEGILTDGDCSVALWSIGCVPCEHRWGKVGTVFVKLNFIKSSS